MIANYFDNIDRLFLTVAIIMTITYIIFGIALQFKRPLVLAGLFAGMLITHLHIPNEYFDIKSCGGLGDIGIVLFMMLLGSQFSAKDLFKHKADAMISIFSIAIPFVIGFFLAPTLLKYDPLSHVLPKDVLVFRIFIGLAVSMTTFSLLSMFISHTDLINSKIGNLAVLCGSIDEFVFWLLLGTVLVFYQESEIFGAYAIHGVIAYLLFMIFIAPRLVKYIAAKISSDRSMLGFMIVGCFTSAVFADIVNLHEIFGAFIFGLMLPEDNPYLIKARGQISDVVTLMLLPIYFVKAGMYTNLHILLNQTVFILALAVTTLAILSKFGGAFITGALLGYSKVESMLLGSLLNMRGVIEVVILNIGLELDIISQNIYSVLIIMTIVSNFVSTSMSLQINSFLQKKSKLKTTTEE